MFLGVVSEVVLWVVSCSLAFGVHDKRNTEDIACLCTGQAVAICIPARSLSGSERNCGVEWGQSRGEERRSV